MAKRKYNSSRRKRRKQSSNKIRIIRSSLLLLLLILILGYLSFSSWKSKQEKLALNNSQIVLSSMGPIEYKSIGSGPIIILSHMGGTGSDNIKLFQEIADAGYRIICPSRAGYLGTPLSSNADIEYHADMYAELLNQLNITEKVFIMGVSAGGPSAIEFAHKYSDRCKGLILHSAICKNFSPLNRMKDFSQLINFMLSPTWQDPLSWADHKGSRLFPTRFIQEILERATNYNHDTTKIIAKQLSKNEKNKELLFLFNDFTSPLSIRTDGLQNDIKYAEKFTPKSVNVPVLLTHSRIDKVVDVFHSQSLKKKLKIAELFEYDGNGHAFWFGKDWINIKNKTFAFLNKYKNDQPIVEDKIFTQLSSETWVSKMNGALLKISPDGIFSLDFPGVDDDDFISGNVSYEKGKLTFSTNSKSNYCKGISGSYHFKIKKNELILSPIEDKCKSRKEHFSNGWFKL